MAKKDSNGSDLAAGTTLPSAATQREEHLREMCDDFSTLLDGLTAIEDLLPNSTDCDKALACVKGLQAFALDKCNRLHGQAEEASK